MTDLEMTKLCAEAMEIQCSVMAGTVRSDPYHNVEYNPLHDDAQAMALVKKFKLFVNHSDVDESPYWKTAPHGRGVTTCNSDLNRAIVECVAKMQAEK